MTIWFMGLQNYENINLNKMMVSCLTVWTWKETELSGKTFEWKDKISGCYHLCRRILLDSDFPLNSMCYTFILKLFTLIIGIAFIYFYGPWENVLFMENSTWSHNFLHRLTEYILLIYQKIYSDILYKWQSSLQMTKIF